MQFAWQLKPQAYQTAVKHLQLNLVLEIDDVSNNCMHCDLWNMF